MNRRFQATLRWPLWLRIAVTAAATIIVYLVQVPLEHEVPGEPFLLFSLVVISATLTFGPLAGFIAVGLSTFLSMQFFEPYGSLSLVHAGDLIKIELYAIVGAA